LFQCAALRRKDPGRTGYQYSLLMPFVVRRHCNCSGRNDSLTKPGGSDHRQRSADVVFLAREMLRDPYWPLHAAKAWSVDLEWPKQYSRAKL